MESTPAPGRMRVVLEPLGRELAYAARLLRRSPGVSLLSVATMGVGIGVSAVLFALVNAIVLRPLPYPEADRLVRIFDTNRTAGVERAGAASGNIDDWRRRASAVLTRWCSCTASTSWSPTRCRGERAESGSCEMRLMRAPRTARSSAMGRVSRSRPL